MHDPAISRSVVELYSNSMLTLEAVGKKIGVSSQTARAILKRDIDTDILATMKKLRYSASKTGSLNPMKGKAGEQHHNYIGDCNDHKGYLTRVVDGRRYFSHRIAVAKHLRIHVKDLPQDLVIHHIDENPLNNSIHNLAICTSQGHSELHNRYKKSRQELELRGLSMAEAIRYMTSP